MKKLILMILVIGLMAVPAFAGPSWYTGAGNQTHQLFDFESDDVEWDAQEGAWGVVPTVDNNPFGPASGWVELVDDGKAPFGYNSDLGVFFGHEINVFSGLFIPNQNIRNPVKDIYIEIEYYGDPTATWYNITGPFTDSDWVEVSYVDTAGIGQWGILTIEAQIRPNPEWEQLWFHFEDSGAALDSIEVWTQCVPAPGAVLLGSLGCGLVGWLRRRRSL